MSNDFCYLELQANDLGKAKEFYAELFDWKMESMMMEQGGEYSVFRPEKGPAGGIMQNPAPESPGGWLVYISVENIEEKVNKARQLGGSVIVDKTPVPGMGHFAIMMDNQGAVFALWQE